MQLQRDRGHGLEQFPTQRSSPGTVQVLGELLGDRASALHDPAGPDVGGERPSDPDDVDAVVTSKAMVLDDLDGLADLDRNLVQGRPASFLHDVGVKGDQGLGFEREAVETLSGPEILDVTQPSPRHVELHRRGFPRAAGHQRRAQEDGPVVPVTVKLSRLVGLDPDLFVGKTLEPSEQRDGVDLPAARDRERFRVHP